MKSSEYPGGEVFDDREDALMVAKEYREGGEKSYARVAYFTKEEFEALPEME